MDNSRGTCSGNKRTGLFGETQSTNTEFYSDDELINAIDENSEFEDALKFEYSGIAKPKNAIEVKMASCIQEVRRYQKCTEQSWLQV